MPQRQSEPLNHVLVNRGHHPSQGIINAAKEILGVCGSSDDRQVTHVTTPIELARSLEAFLRNHAPHKPKKARAKR